MCCTQGFWPEHPPDGILRGQHRIVKLIVCLHAGSLKLVGTKIALLPHSCDCEKLCKMPLSGSSDEATAAYGMLRFEAAISLNGLGPHRDGSSRDVARKRQNACVTAAMLGCR